MVAGFDGGNITSNAGALLLGQVSTGALGCVALPDCFIHLCDPRYVEHQVDTVDRLAFGWRRAMKTSRIAIISCARTDVCGAVEVWTRLLRRSASHWRQVRQSPEHTPRLTVSNIKIDCDDAGVQMRRFLFGRRTNARPRQIAMDFSIFHIPLHGQLEGRLSLATDKQYANRCFTRSAVQTAAGPPAACERRL